MQPLLYIRYDGTLFRYITRVKRDDSGEYSVVCECLDTGERIGFVETQFRGTIEYEGQMVPTFRRINPAEEFDSEIACVLRRLHVLEAMNVIPDPWRLIAAALGIPVTTSMSHEERTAVKLGCRLYHNGDQEHMSAVLNDGTLVGEQTLLRALHVLSLLKSRLGCVTTQCT